MLNIKLLLPAVPVAIIAASQAIKAVAAVRQLKEIRKISDAISEVLTVKVQEPPAEAPPATPAE